MRRKGKCCRGSPPQAEYPALPDTLLLCGKIRLKSRKTSGRIVCDGSEYTAGVSLPQKQHPALPDIFYSMGKIVL